MKYLRAFKCEYCRLGFSDFDCFKKHIKRHKLSYASCSTIGLNRTVKHLPKRRNHAQLLGRKKLTFLKNPHEVGAHNAVHILQVKEVYHCRTCSIIFASKCQKDRHHLECNNRDLIFSHLCVNCQTAVSSQSELVKHEIKKKHCAFCKNRFTSIQGINSHRVGSVEKLPHPNLDEVYCSYCSDSFQDRASLSKHNYYAHRCPYCRMCFSSKEDHVIKQHLCHFCLKYFKDLRLHKGCTSKCPYCSLVFDSHTNCQHNSQNCTECYSQANKLLAHISAEHAQQGRAVETSASKIQACHKDKDIVAKQEEPTLTLYECKRCKKTFHSPCQLNRHFQRVHREVATYACANCDEVFFDEINQLKHEYLKLHCAFCKDCFSSQQALMAHWEERQDNNTGEDSTQANCLGDAHSRGSKTIDRSSNRCNVCLKVFKSQCHKKWHNMRYHNKDINKDNKTTCQNCFSVIRNQRDQIQHEMLTNHCAICSKNFKNLQQLMTHWKERQVNLGPCPCMRCFEGQKKNESGRYCRCRFCSKYYSKSGYVHHKHYAEHKCPYCSGTYKYDSLLYHVESDHKCEYCKKFFTHNDLFLHTHDNETDQPMCVYCQKEYQGVEVNVKCEPESEAIGSNLNFKWDKGIGTMFSLECDYNYHLMYHSDVSIKYKCKKCRQLLGKREVLQHEVLHNHCIHCTESFTGYEELQLHWKKRDDVSKLSFQHPQIEHCEQESKNSQHKKCPYCSEIFDPCILQKHLHLEHKCDFCQKFFTYQDLVLHNELGQHKCECCQVVFQNADLLLHYQSRKHKHKNDQQEYSHCGECNTSLFTSQCQLNWHLMCHDNSSAEYTCKNCGLLVGKRDLMQHEMMMMHCAYCKEVFTQMTDLQSHWRQRQETLSSVTMELPISKGKNSLEN